MSDSILRLYVWKSVWSDYTDGVAFALAHSADEARLLIIANLYKAGHTYDWLASDLQKEPEVYDRPYGFGVMGGG